VVGVDDWGHRQDSVLGVVDDGVNGGIFDDMQIFRQVLLRLQPTL